MKGSPSGPVQVFSRNVTNVDHGSIAAATTEWLAVTVAGVAASAVLLSASPAADLPAGIGFAGARVSGEKTVRIGLSNSTAGAVTADDLVWNLTFFIPDVQ